MLLRSSRYLHWHYGQAIAFTGITVHLALNQDSCRGMQVRQDLKGRTLMGLVNNAGVMSFGPLLYQPLSDFQQHLDVNVVGVFNVMQVGP